MRFHEIGRLLQRLPRDYRWRVTSKFNSRLTSSLKKYTGNRKNFSLIFANDGGVCLRNGRAKTSHCQTRAQLIVDEMFKIVHYLPTKSGDLQDRLPTRNLNWKGAEIVKVELNDALSGKLCKSPVSSRLVSLDGTWWVIDVNDPDLEGHLKQSAHRAEAARARNP